MKSRIVKRSIVIAGHKTSVSLEEPFWQSFREIAAARDMSLSEVAGAIDAERRQGNLSSAIRLFVLRTYRRQLAEHEQRLRTRDTLAGVSAPKQGH